jgi:hypothetical protein
VGGARLELHGEFARELVSPAEYEGRLDAMNLDDAPLVRRSAGALSTIRAR